MSIRSVVMPLFAHQSTSHFNSFIDFSKYRLLVSFCFLYFFFQFYGLSLSFLLLISGLICFLSFQLLKIEAHDLQCFSFFLIISISSLHLMFSFILWVIFIIIYCSCLLIPLSLLLLCVFLFIFLGLWVTVSTSFVCLVIV